MTLTVGIFVFAKKKSGLSGVVEAMSAVVLLHVFNSFLLFSCMIRLV